MKLSTSTPPTVASNPRLSQWLQVDGPGRKIVVCTGKVELGQGIATALLQIACDALGVEPGQVTLVAGSTAASPDEGYTAGSLSIQYGGAALHWACSHLYARFRAAAATRLGAPAQALQTAAGVFSTGTADTSADYWSLAADVPLDVTITEPPAATREAQTRFVGASMPRLDFAKKFSGAAFVHDLVIPGMRHVRVLRGRHPAQRLTRVPTAELEALDGVDQVFRSGSFLALIGDHEGALVRALPKAQKLLEYAPLDDPHASHEPRLLLPALPCSTTRVHSSGQKQASVQRLEASYSRPYLAHASIGPACAVADFRDGHLTVWSHTQGPYELRKQIATALSLELAQVEVVHTHGAGCYGHNSADDVAFDAALVATRTGSPVRVQWMRTDEMSVAPFGAPGLVNLQAGLDADGRIGEWSMQLWSPTHLSRPGWGDGVNLLGAWEMDPPWPQPAAVDFPLPAGGADRNAIADYDFPHQDIDYHFIAQSPVRTSSLRSLGSYLNLFAIESFMDELAEMAGRDPVEFRLQHLSDARAKAVVSAAADMAAWTSRDTGGSGVGLGIGFGRYKNRTAYCAIVARVRVEEKIHVEKLWIAVDAGQVVNPDGLVNQIEGGAIQSLSWTLKESVTWDAQGITSCDWDNYPILGFDEIPDIEVRVLDRPDETPLGAGEVAAGPAAAAVANAVSHALGLRARHLPLTPERLAAQIEAE